MVVLGRRQRSRLIYLNQFAETVVAAAALISSFVGAGDANPVRASRCDTELGGSETAVLSDSLDGAAQAVINALCNPVCRVSSGEVRIAHGGHASQRIVGRIHFGRSGRGDMLRLADPTQAIDDHR